MRLRLSDEGEHGVNAGPPGDLYVAITVKPHPVTGIYSGKFGTWLFLASEVMLFGALFSTYVLLRVGAPEAVTVALLNNLFRYAAYLQYYYIVFNVPPRSGPEPGYARIFGVFRRSDSSVDAV